MDTERKNSNSQNHFEAKKLRYDFFKHLTTLSSGVIIITGTVVVGVLEEPVSLEVVVISCCLFLVSILGSLAGMVFQIQHLDSDTEFDKSDMRFYRNAIYVALLGFYFGICSQILFFWLNFRS